ncbi:MAG TPA: DUF2288 domain-containing protein [Oxalicibacterium sp.]|nr:DUF2288 domain-containing protein [Oxalicibacterium sp.]
MMTPEQEQQLLHAKLNMETAQMAWSELLRYFAGGHVIVVSSDLDLVEVAARFTVDDTAAVQRWLDEGRVARASDDQARDWLEADAMLWTVVARPWVLVQEGKPG